MNRASGDRVTLYFGIGTGTVHKAQNSTQTKTGYTVQALTIDELVKSLILLAPQAILGFMTRLAKLQELGLTPSNSLQFLTPDSS